MTTRTRTVLLIVFLLGVAFVVMPRDEAHVPSAPSPEPAAGSANAAPDGSPMPESRRGERAPTREREVQPPAPEKLAPSLRGTEIAGALLVDEDGNFVATADALSMFEYFFTVSGEASREEIVARIRTEIAARLDPPAEAQALAFLERYLAYRDRGLTFGTPGPEDTDLRSRFEKIRDLRREIFGEELASRLFGEDEAAAEVAIRQREIAEDPDLSPEEKAAAIEKSYEDLPEPLRKAREETLAAVRLMEDTDRMRAEGASAEEIRDMRVERFGEEAADRLEDLDRENAAWDGRMAAYRAERDRILASGGLSDVQKAAAIDDLVRSRFEENERLRVEALDAIEAESR